MSGHVEPGPAVLAAFDAYVPKPIHPDELAALVGELASSARARRERRAPS